MAAAAAADDDDDDDEANENVDGEENAGGDAADDNCPCTYMGFAARSMASSSTERGPNDGYGCCNDDDDADDEEASEGYIATMSF